MADNVTALPGRALSPVDVEALVRNASIADLVAYLPVKNEMELEWWLAFREEYGPGRFACPHCQLLPDRDMLVWLGASVTDSIFWWCEICGHRGTRWEIVRLILEDGIALADFLNGEVTDVAS